MDCSTQYSKYIFEYYNKIVLFCKTWVLIKAGLYRKAEQKFSEILDDWST